jgi:hypothetical protein
MLDRLKSLRVFLCIFTLLCLFSSISYANSAGAFMSLPFGHSWTRTKSRMQRSGANLISEKKGNSLTMNGMFEDREALYIFNFVPKGLFSKTVCISSLGNKDDDRALYDSLRKAYESQFGEIKEQTRVGSNNSIALTSLWNPDQYISIILAYNPNTKRFSDNLAVDSPIRLGYMTNKWAK